MTPSRRFEQDPSALLADLYVAGTPDYRDDLVRQIARTPQRSAWTFPERWLPMEVVTTRVPTTRLPIRQLGVLALIAILVAATLAVYVGTQQPQLPAPFGVARSGVVAYETDGDIHVADPSTGDSRAIVTGPERDAGPRFSRDGTHIVFARPAEGSTRLFVTDTDGNDLTEITTEPVRLTSTLLGEPWEQYQFSPDGRSVVIATTTDGVPGISIANTDGSGLRSLRVGMAAHEPSFRPPDGREILFVGQTGGDISGIYAVDPATDKVRTIVEPGPEYGLAGATWSPDGSTIAYWRWGGPGYAGGINARTHIVGADGSGGRELQPAPGAVWDAGSEWSNDGSRLIVVRGYTSDFSDVRAAVIPADGSSPGHEIEYDGVVNGECCAAFEWSPDDRHILVTPSGTRGEPLPQVLIDLQSGSAMPVSWDSRSDPTWQRVAP